MNKICGYCDVIEVLRWVNIGFYGHFLPLKFYILEGNQDCNRKKGLKVEITLLLLSTFLSSQCHLLDKMTPKKKEQNKIKKNWDSCVCPSGFKTERQVCIPRGAALTLAVTQPIIMQLTSDSSHITIQGL